MHFLLLFFSCHLPIFTEPNVFNNYFLIEGYSFVDKLIKAISLNISIVIFLIKLLQNDGDWILSIVAEKKGTVIVIILPLFISLLKPFSDLQFKRKYTFILYGL